MSDSLQETFQLITPGERDIRITRQFAAPKALVYAVITQPEHIRQWWGCSGSTMVVCEMDFRVGGQYRFVLEMPDGSQHPFCGEYLEISPPDRLSNTFIYDVDDIRNHPAIETVVLTETEGITTLTATIVHESQLHRDGHVQSGMEFGARGSYNRLGELLDHLSQPGVTIQVQKDFAASAEAVFQAWLDPVQLTKWMFGPAVRDEELVRLQTDPRPGGRFSYVVRRQGQEIDHVGSYLELAPPHKLAFTWGIAGQSLDESRVDIDIEALDAGCRLTLTHRIPAQWADYAERTQQGWFKMLEKLSETLSSQTETIACP